MEDSWEDLVEAPYFRSQKASAAWERSVMASSTGTFEVVERRELALQNEAPPPVGLCGPEQAESGVLCGLAGPLAPVFPPLDAAVWLHAPRLFRARIEDAR